MAIKSKAQIQAESNSTYVDNSVGSITPTSVRSLNTNWIDSIIFAEATASLNVFSATSASFATSASRAESAATASFLTGTVASASFAIQASTASFLLGSVESASFATSASRAISSATATSASYSLTSSLAQRNLITASAAANILTFTKGDGTTFNVSIAQSGSVNSASFADTANQANSASLASNSLLLQGTGSNGFATTASLTAVSSSLQAVSSSTQQVSASYIALSASYNTFSGSASTRITNTSQSLQAVSASTQQVSASYIALSASYNVSSGSESARITNLESFSSSLDATFATDAQLNAATQSLSASTSTVNTRVTEVSSSLLQVSASYIALSGSYNVFSGSESARTTTLESTASALVAASGSFSTRVSNNTSNIQTLTSATASYAVLGNNQTFTGTNAFNNAVTMSNVKVTGTASIAFLDVTFQSSSIIYSSGSNQFGDASDDTQTLWGTVNVISGPLVVTGSANFKNVITGSISGNAATATTSTSASFASTANFANTAEFATSASLAQFAGIASAALSASYAYTASSAISASFASVAASVLGTITSASYAFTASSAVNATNALTASSVSSLNQTLTVTGSVNVSGSIRISQGDDLITHHVQAAASNGLELQNNGGNVIALLGAGGGLGTTFNGQVNATAFSGSGALVYGVVSSSYALTASYLDGAVPVFPFTGSAGITGSLDLVGRLYIPSGSIEITGSATIFSGSLTMFSYKFETPSNRPYEALVTQSLNSTNNIISLVGVGATGSLLISGSGNYISLNTIASNVQHANGATSGFNGTNAYITVMPITTGSNPNFNTTADRNNRRVPQITNSNVNATINVIDNRQSEASAAPVGISNSSINSSIVVTVDSGSFSINNSNIAGASLTVSSSNATGSAAGGVSSISNSILANNGINVRLEGSASRSATINSSIIAGTTTRLLVSASAAYNAAISSNLIVGDNLIVTSSYYTSGFGLPVGSAFLGSFNAADGVLNSPQFTRFAIGTGTVGSARRTSFHVSASGLTTINDSLDVRGINSGLTELEVRTTGVKIGNLITDSHNLTGSFSITGSQTITGSLVAETISGSFSGSGAEIFGVVSSSYAYTASSAVISLSSSYSDNSNTANSATSATSASYAYTASSAENSANSISASYAYTASSAISSSYALTASYLEGAVPVFPFTGSAAITGSLTVTGSIRQFVENTGSKSATITAVTNSFVGNTQITGSGNGNNALRVSGSGNFQGSLTVSKNLLLGSTSLVNNSTLTISANTGSSLSLISAGTQPTSSFNVLSADSSGAEGTQFSVQSTFANLKFLDTDNAILGQNVFLTIDQYGTASVPSIPTFTRGLAVTGSTILTGSLVGQPVSQSVSSLTASLNLATGNFFNLTLPASANTYITASGQVPGQTINLKITQQATTGSVTLGAGFKQVSGSAYTVTATANAVDIVTFISFDNTGLYVSNVKNLI